MSSGRGPPPDRSESSTSLLHRDSDAESSHDEGETDEPESFTDTAVYKWGRDIGAALLLSMMLTTALVLVTGVWPPFAAVSSGSMDPHIQQGDVIVIMEEGRFPPGAAGADGIVTYRQGKDVGYRSFGDYGSVIVFRSGPSDSQSTVHRAMFHVEKDENWYDRANKVFLDDATSCESLRNCPAPNAGFITKGDANPFYDQSLGMSPPIRKQWVKGTARWEVPFVGWLKLVTGG